MLRYRLLSAVGRVAHFGNEILDLFAPARGLGNVGAPLMAAVLLVAGLIVGAIGLDAAAKTPRACDVEVLVADSGAGSGLGVTVSGYLREEYVEVTQSGSVVYYEYLLVSPAGDAGIIVRSKVGPIEMLPLCYAYSECDRYRVLSGVLREAGDVQKSLDAMGSGATGGMTIPTGYVLMDGEGPPPAFPLLLVSAVALSASVIALIGWRAGYLIFRPGPAGETAELMPSKLVVVRVTGILRTPDATLRAREMPASLVASEPLPGWPSPDGSGATPMAGGDRPVDLIWGEMGPTRGLRLTPGGLERVTPGEAIPWGGPRPALLLQGRTGRLLLSFDREGDRDRVLEQLRASGGLTRLPGGALALYGLGSDPA